MLASMDRAEVEFEEHREIISGQITVAGFATAARALPPVHGIGFEASLLASESLPPESIPLLARRDLDLVIAQDWENARRPSLETLRAFAR
jgi:hypothetical protein